MSAPAIEVEGLGKLYQLAHESRRHQTFRDAITDMALSPLRRLRRLRGSDTSMEDFWALKNVSFDVATGEVVGIIGRNGAGKSTLLKILSRIVEPTEGRATLRGRVASLLEVGTGFHPELSGRENIYLNGSILGMKKREIDAQFDAIVYFAEVEKFLDTPVKRYSSGMYVRLAFAVAAHLEPEILIVDEVLAVGDAEFQKKCLGKMKDVAAGGDRTILFVSHNLAAVRSLCSSAILLSGGKSDCIGPVEDVLEMYLSKIGQGASSVWCRTNSLKEKDLAFETITAQIVGSQPKIELKLDVSLSSKYIFRPAFIAVDICDSLGVGIMQAIPSLSPFMEGAGFHRLTIAVELPPMVPGRYWVTLWAGPHNSTTYDMVSECVVFDIADTPQAGRTFPHTSDHGYIVPVSRCTYEYSS